MEIRQLQYVVRVAETLHFGRAAELEHIAASALSTHIRRLESRLDVKLFERTPHQVLVTPAGVHFVREAQEILDRLDRLRTETQSIARSATEHLSIGFFGEALGELTHQVFGAFAAEFPQTRLEFTELSMSTQFEDLGSGVVDVAFFRMPIDDPRFEVRPLFQERLYAAVAAAGPFGQAASLTVEDIIDQPFAVAGDTTPTEWADFWTLAGVRGAPGRTGALVRTLNESLSAVAYSGAIDTYPASATRTFRHPGVRFIPISDAPASIQAFVWRRGSANPMIPELLEVTRAVIRDHIDDLPEAESLVD
ncbi:LysR family transcriptional regulator (plasmid) [Citricoccus sp. SGAir0253]|uniref:LysR substrate-binding domain-containing protein n=1 Tax=Citricoccus sp. SGAir0253 TaxID=2567881 RepID=UPI0010CCECF6|nr:LysR substrate-binding domain-containing protein [Citricoccus sp. SGAir0253]QCU79654.1 LysR family transcriptional regulator [Citricoccus sp. SGAir0253]